MPKTKQLNFKIEDDKKIIFGGNDDSSIYWDNSANQLKITTDSGSLIIAGNLTVSGTILTVNGTYQGEILLSTVDANSTGFGAALYMAADFNYEEADASSTTTMPVAALACETGTGSKKVILRGQLCDTSWNWSVGSIFASTTSGTLTQTVVSGTGEQAQIVGHALSADTIYFNPDYTLVEI